MSDDHITLDGHPASHARVSVPRQGAWFAEVDLVDAPNLPAGKITLQVGALSLTGTVRPEHDGVFLGRRQLMLVAGADGWSRPLPRRALTNPAGVAAKNVAQDAAQAVGETLGSFAGKVERLGQHYCREAGLASAIIEDAARGATWWVDFAGVTQVGERSTTALQSGTYNILEVNPREKVVTIDVDDLSSINVGSVLQDSDRLPEPITITSYEIQASPDSTRVVAWYGEGETSREVDLLKGIIQRATDQRLLGKYRYEVVSMAGNKVTVRASKTNYGPAKLPDTTEVDVWPGMAGSHAELKPGSEVLVEFIGGDRSEAIITALARKGGNGFVPVSATIEADTITLKADTVNLAGKGGKPVARQGDPVEFVASPGQFAGTINGLPASGVVTWLKVFQGTIKGGSGKTNST